MAKKKKDEEAVQETELQEEVTEETAEADTQPEAEKEESAEEKLQKQLDEKDDQLKRLAAEYDNFRKRSQREKDALYTECKASVIKTLLPVADNFDRIFENTEVSFEDYKKGVEMTFKEFDKMFKSLDVEEFGKVGETFDPNMHNAVMHTEDDSLDENVITQVFAKGYKIKEKIIRPAMVAVAN